MKPYFSGWEESVFSCPKCKWEGVGTLCEQGEPFADEMELLCPQCGFGIDAILFPTIKECKENWKKLSKIDQGRILYQEEFERDFHKRKLLSPDQLPVIHDEDLILVWDASNASFGGDTLIRYGSRIIWRERAVYEGFERFVEVARILLKKYGKNLQDLVPTIKSHIYLYGDATRSLGIVERTRSALRSQTDLSDENREILIQTGEIWKTRKNPSK